MLVFKIKRGDTSPALRFALLPESVSLAGADVRFQMRRARSFTVIDNPATVVEATGTPTVEYAWQAGDTDVTGIYQAEFRVTYSDSTIETFPNYGFIDVIISDDIPSLT